MMLIEWQNHREFIFNALADLYKSEWDLLDFNINERTLSAHLACYLKKYYPGYHVDCEYNRFGDEGQVKKILPSPELIQSNDTQARTIFPDIIVHKRGKPSKNLLVIEIKKSAPRVSPQDLEKDYHKLRELTKSEGSFRYQYGIHLTLGKGGVDKTRVFSRGTENSALSDEFRTYLRGLMA